MKQHSSSPQLAAGMHVEWVGDEAVVLDSENARLHYLNPPAALVFALIAETGYEGALERLHRSYGDVADLQGDVHSLIDELREKGVLVDG
jgi:hypothetical protein